MSALATAGKIYTAKRGMEEGRLTAELSSQPVGLERRDKSFLVGCMDDHVYCFSNHVSTSRLVYLEMGLCR